MKAYRLWRWPPFAWWDSAELCSPHMKSPLGISRQSWLLILGSTMSQATRSCRSTEGHPEGVSHLFHRGGHLVNTGCLVPFYLTFRLRFLPMISFAISNSFQQLQDWCIITKIKISKEKEKNKTKNTSPDLPSISQLLWKLRAVRGILAANDHGNKK